MSPIAMRFTRAMGAVLALLPFARVTGAVLALLPLAFAGIAGAADPPRLVLVISVDQMRADYLGKFPFSKGFAKLTGEGAVFTEAYHAHIPTETGPGHSVILTGKLPAQTGIVGNEWWDRASRRGVTAFSDSVYGSGPENLLAYTLGDGMKARDPRTLVVAVSLKDRAAIPLGGKRADLAVWYDKKSERAVTSTYYGVPPAWLGPLAGSNAMLETPAGDEFVLRLALEALEHVPLGTDDVPDILAVSFSSPDYVGHHFGIDGPQLAVQYDALDDVLARLIAAAEKQAGAGRVIVALTADHGVVPAPEDPSGQAMKVHREDWDGFGKALEARLQKIRPTVGRPWLLLNAIPNLYLDQALAHELGVDWPAFLETAAAAVRTMPGIAEVYTPADYWKSDVVRRSYYAPRSGDLIAIPQYAALFTDYPAGTSHGTPYDYDSHVPVILWGAPFKPGRYADRAGVADIAPTLGQVLGVTWPAAEGSRVLGECLR